MGNFASDQQALRTGFVLGALAKAGIPAYPETDDDGDYIPAIHVRIDVGDPEPIDVVLEVRP